MLAKSLVESSNLLGNAGRSAGSGLSCWFETRAMRHEYAIVVFIIVVQENAPTQHVYNGQATNANNVKIHKSTANYYSDSSP